MRDNRWWTNSSRWDEAELSSLLGKTLVSAQFHRALPTYDDEVDVIEFVCADGEKLVVRRDITADDFLFVEQIVGDFSSLVGLPIVRVEWRQGDDIAPGDACRLHFEVCTGQASVTINWYCESYYKVPAFSTFRYVSKEEEEASRQEAFARWDANKGREIAVAKTYVERARMNVSETNWASALK